MPRVDGIQATRQLRAGPPAPPVLVLTTFDDDEVLWGVLKAGAAGFVLKDAGAEDLTTAARTVRSPSGRMVGGASSCCRHADSRWTVTRPAR
jgi:DNA-binding NarL/FixJ family response regulator